MPYSLRNRTAPRFYTEDRQAEIVPLVLAERRRRELYLGCDRAPEFGAKHVNLAAQ